MSLLGKNLLATNSEKKLLNTRYTKLARNTIDYWMAPDSPRLSYNELMEKLTAIKYEDDASISIYIHVPFCAQKCSFCAFSGGNSLQFKEAERYSQLLVKQLLEMTDLLKIGDRPIRSVNIGGGSPDLLGANVARVLAAVTQLPGFSSATELAVEIALSTARPAFLEQLIKYKVHKLSFGLQTLSPVLRKHIRVPVKYEKSLSNVLDIVRGKIPVINADLITCLPGQTLAMAQDDLNTLINHPDINSISSYLLTSGAAPALVASVLSGAVPDQASQHEQSIMRLNSYNLLQRKGWIRKGTNTYMDPKAISEATLELMGGNECIGTGKYEDILIGVGPQAISCYPGLRVENTVDINDWIADIEAGRNSFYLPKCSLVDQPDSALWTFPLRFSGLSNRDLKKMLNNGSISAKQFTVFNQFVEEGLIQPTANGFELSILGEVFMGHMVHDLKKPEFQSVLKEYIAEGNYIGQLLANKKLKDDHYANNRQLVDSHAFEKSN